MAEAPDINVDELRRRARRRLLGAVVLALAAAVLIPMLLESDPKPLGEDVSVKIPPMDNGKFVNRLSDKGGKANAVDAPRSEPAKEAMKAEPPKGEPPQNAPSESVASPTNVPAPKKSIAQAEQKMLGAPAKPAVTGAAVPAPGAAAPGPTTAAPAAVAVPSNAPPPAAVVAAPASADPPREGFSVQLAAFADDKGANSLANKLKRAAYPAYTEPLTTSKGTLWRVRVGPYLTRDDATAVRDKLKGEGYSGIVAAAK
jgi:DedD protein